MRCSDHEGSGQGERLQARDSQNGRNMYRDVPLIITATPNVSWLYPEVRYPRTIEALVQEAARCQAAGAAILHVHAEAQWAETVEALQSASDMIIQCGMSSLPIPERMDVFHQGADMISVIASHHDEAFSEVDVHVLHPREELIEYAALARAYGVKLEMEIWHAGSAWNLRYMIDRGLLEPPCFTSLFFGWPGGTWSPPTVEEYLSRIRVLPLDAVKTVSAMGGEQLQLLATAIAHGDHVRVGTEDHPFNRAGEHASTHELVAEIVELASALGRPIASPAEARTMVGLPGRKAVRGAA